MRLLTSRLLYVNSTTVLFNALRMSSKRAQPPWNPPLDEERPKLKLWNSLTRQKEEFKPQRGNRVTWYNCGPTVYDASHMGHARNYLTFDILRRVLTNYFGYDMFFVMNITDVDDKIIKRARQNYLYEKYAEEKPNVEKVLDDANSALKSYIVLVQDTTDPDKKKMQETQISRLEACLAEVSKALAGKDAQAVENAGAKLLEEAKDILSEWIDKQSGSGVKDNSIFEALPRYWEEQFHTDMEALNILPADCLTRVSEYIPENVAFISKIIDQGYAYASPSGSVYFDTVAFDKEGSNHHYCKLVPEAFGDSKAANEGEGDLGAPTDGEKRNVTDFALWKVAKPGEPSWESPWGRGRPGWHIECSAMASEVIGSTIDIHTGGADLKFPHHDNELAQSEAYHGNDCWIRYFLHSGHLTIAGCKMSKSLKNFITIQDVLKRYTARQLRLTFLMHSWKDTLDYSDSTMQLAVSYEKVVNEFLLKVKHILRTTPSTGVASFSRWREEEVQLQKHLEHTRATVHKAFCDNVDTRAALEAIKELVSEGNAYMIKKQQEKAVPNRGLLKSVASYITRIFDVVGLIAKPEEIGLTSASSSNQSANTEEMVMPFLTVLSNFRDAVRIQAKEIKAVPILKECDKVRDDTLPELGVRLEDSEDGVATVIKLVDKEELLRERQIVRELEERKRAEKERKKKEAEGKKRLQDEQKKTNPAEMFLKETDKYSKFDEKGLPTHNVKGEEIAKSQLKKLQKLYQAQEKKYQEYLKQSNGVES